MGLKLFDHYLPSYTEQYANLVLRDLTFYLDLKIRWLNALPKNSTPRTAVVWRQAGAVVL